jgi:hypothetical protein
MLVLNKNSSPIFCIISARVILVEVITSTRCVFTLVRHLDFARFANNFRNVLRFLDSVGNQVLELPGKMC